LLTNNADAKNFPKKEVSEVSIMKLNFILASSPHINFTRNSSADQIANVNFLTMTSYTYYKIQ